MRILVADDDREIVELLNIYLHNEGYDVIKAYNGHQALSYIKNDVDHEIGLIILDIMMPKIDGMQVLDKLRAANYETPVLMLSAKSSDQDKIQGLTSGADDYVTKPFSNRELIARVKANLRRNLVKEPEPQEVNKNEIVVGDLVIHQDAYIISKHGEEIELTHREFELLHYLARHIGQVMTREHLLETVWDYDYFGDVRTVDVTIRRLREKIEDIPSHPTYIVTRRGVGYLLKNPDQE